MAAAAEVGASSRDADCERTLIPGCHAIERTGARAAALVVLRGPEIGSQFALRRRRTLIGRGEDVDLVLQDRTISRVHAAVEAVRAADGTVYRLEDLESANHVFVNGVRTASHRLADGDKIQLGDVLLKFELHDAIDAKFHTELRSRIRHDELTGLLTYASFRTALAWELGRRTASATGCAVLMMDLDDFKRLNDTHGHLAGSAVLREVGATIRGNLRRFDVAARYGGEEFVAYLPETAAGEASTAAERLRACLAECVFVHGGRSIRLTISIGVSHDPEDGRDPEALVRIADERLYEAKRGGKNRVAAWT